MTTISTDTLIKSLRQTAGYFADNGHGGGGDYIGTLACEDAIKHIRELRAENKKLRHKIQGVADRLAKIAAIT